MGNPITSALSRVWVIKYRARPSSAPEYMGTSRAGSVEQSLGDVTPIRVPSSKQYGAFEEIGVIKGAEDRPTTSIETQYYTTLSYMKKLVEIKCPFDVQIHFGLCETPTLFNAGWGKVIIIENTYATNFSTGDLGTLEDGDNAKVTETVDLSGEMFYEVVPIKLVERAQTEVGQEVIAVVVGDNPSCGDCGTPSDGCQRVYAVSKPAGSSPGVLPEVIFTPDGGTTWGDTWITTLAIGEDPNDATAIGENLVVVSNADLGIHYADLTDIQNGVETWTKIATGFVAAKGPNAITSIDAAHTWIVGNGGYVYFADDVTAGVEVQDAGAATVQNLNDVHAYDAENVVAVGASNAVVHTSDGKSWALVVGPAVGVTLNAVFMHSEKLWFIGDAGGNLWYTEDEGVNWHQILFPGSGAGSVTAINFATDSVGYLAHATATPAGRILRTIDGGRSWYVLPEKAGSIPSNDKINSLAVCYREANVVYAGGLADNAADGIIIKGS